MDVITSKGRVNIAFTDFMQTSYGVSNGRQLLSVKDGVLLSIVGYAEHILLKVRFEVRSYAI